MRARILRTTVLSSTLAAALITPPLHAIAAAPNWTSTSSTDWFTPGNWSTTSVPAPADTVTINLGTFGPNIVTTGATATNVEVGTNATGGTMNLSIGGGLTDTNGYLGFNAGSTGARWESIPDPPAQY